MTKGYIFDYGGTLDTAGRHWGKVIWDAYCRHGVAVTEQQFRDAYVFAERALGSNHIIKPDYTFHKTLDVKLELELGYIKTEGHLHIDNAAITELRRDLLSDLYERVKAETSRSRNVLSTINEKYPMVLVSNFYGNINTVLKEFHLDGLFKSVIESAAVGIRKPDYRIFTLGVKALGIKPEETIVVGDSYDKDIAPAKEAGCKAVWMKGEGWTEEDYDESLPDATITNISDLLQIGLD